MLASTSKIRGHSLRCGWHDNGLTDAEEAGRTENEATALSLALDDTDSQKTDQAVGAAAQQAAASLQTAHTSVS